MPTLNGISRHGGYIWIIINIDECRDITKVKLFQITDFLEHNIGKKELSIQKHVAVFFLLLVNLTCSFILLTLTVTKE